MAHEYNIIEHACSAAAGVHLVRWFHPKTNSENRIGQSLVKSSRKLGHKRFCFSYFCNQSCVLTAGDCLRPGLMYTLLLVCSQPFTPLALLLPPRLPPDAPLQPLPVPLPLAPHSPLSKGCGAEYALAEYDSPKGLPNGGYEEALAIGPEL